MLCGRSVYDVCLRMHPLSYDCATHGAGHNTDTWIPAYAFDLPSVRQGIDVEHTVVCGKPHGRLDRCAVPFDTLQVEILLVGELRESIVAHGFLVDHRD